MARPEPCVLELVSKLAREPWTDRPACVHPVLGSIARMVHDHSTKAGRRKLLPLAPAFLGTAEPGIDRSARLVALCVATARTAATDLGQGERGRLARAHQTALFLLKSAPAPDGPARWWLPVLDRIALSEPLYRNFIAPEHAAEAVVVAARTADDIRLRHLLKQCLRLLDAKDMDVLDPQPRLAAPRVR
ncbi:hypothetical protein [Kribbella sp. CA-293567]|uniref:hypothetical protein n=1 Tax=Kribbella sp. CA-293567 TaxID=3002436 RepID=UPI0022DE25F6|nr:hypothetical protein [Kribbella sp. CA-293567]WBQ03356.1 hypothetical protein OX958_25680 [Kribbella sp. CA-293567]